MEIAAAWLVVLDVVLDSYIELTVCFLRWLEHFLRLGSLLMNSKVIGRRGTINSSLFCHSVSVVIVFKLNDGFVYGRILLRSRGTHEGLKPLLAQRFLL